METPPSKWRQLYGKTKYDNISNDRRPEMFTKRTLPECKVEQVIESINQCEGNQLMNSSCVDSCLDCIDQLVGKKNVFAPELRLDAHSNDNQAAARELIRSRLYFEQRSGTFKRGQKIQKREEAANSFLTGSINYAKVSYNYMSNMEGYHSSQKTAKSNISHSKPRDIPQAKRRDQGNSLVKHSTKDNMKKELKNHKKVSPETITVSSTRNVARTSNQTTVHNEQKVKQFQKQLKFNEKEIRTIDKKIKDLQEEVQERRGDITEDDMRWKEKEGNDSCLAWKAWEGYRLLKMFWKDWRLHVSQKRSLRCSLGENVALRDVKKWHKKADEFFRGRLLPKVFFAWASYTANCREKRDIVSATLKRKDYLVKLLSEMDDNKTIVHNSIVHPPAIPTAKAGFMGHHVDNSALDEDLASFRIPTNDHKTPESCHSENEGQFERDSLRDVSGSNRNQNMHKNLKDKSEGKNIYTSMMERAEKRKQKREELKQKYEANAKKKKEEEENLQKDLEMKALELKNEERRARQQEKMLAQKRNEARRAMREKEAQHGAQAARHYVHACIYYYGFFPWTKFIQQIRLNLRKARLIYEDKILAKCLACWRAHHKKYQEDRFIFESKRRQLAEEFYVKHILRNSMKGWLIYHYAHVDRKLAITRNSQWNTLKRAFFIWRHQFFDALLLQREREKHALKKMERKHLTLCFHAWRDKVQAMRRDQMLDAQKEEMWQKVRVWLDE